MKKLIVPGVKDASGAYIKTEEPKPKAKRFREPIASEISLNELMDKHLLLLFRETKMLLEESSKGQKLSKDSAHSMRENLKMIVDLKRKERELLDTLSTDELTKLAEKQNEDNDSEET